MASDRGKSNVYLLRSSDRDDLVASVDALLERSGIEGIAREDQIVAVKMHFGESSQTGHVRPHFIRRIVAWLMRRGHRPFVTDANTLYRGTRCDAIAHLRAAAEHGFTQSALGAPVVIADGLRGTTETRLPFDGRHVSEAAYGAELIKADAVLSVAHFKGHELSGFGGAIKNVGMGGASRSGKLEQHSTTKPFVRDTCIACGTCAEWCPVDAILVDERAAIDDETCIGCGECIAVCPVKAVGIRWDQATDIFQEKMVEYTKALSDAKPGAVGYVNFITDVHPVCDCYGAAKEAICPDVGIVASLDPVAIDQASYDLVNEAPASEAGDLSPTYRQGSDKFKDLHPEVDSTVQLRYAEALGLGTRDYELIEVDTRP
ncbi:MAG: DUF362 domain-containing protein [Candidatus Eisenbacteria bacterium]|nr:DUF362 domain-containing protein [Candidatus Eisenbacteria bacterium]